jgi:hypothetical protein
MKRMFLDERTERINGRVSFIVLMLTHLALAGLVVYRRYFLGLPETEVVELNWILGLSMGGYWALRLYFSGILPVVSFRKMLTIYLAAVALIFIPTLLIVGLPAPDRWYEMLYPFIGVALVLGFYSLVAWLGKRRLDNSLTDE